MTKICDVAIIGAGPYGLSLAAHLKARNIDFRIFGKPLDTWRKHMPKDMQLKSDGFASNLDAPEEGRTLKAYCAAEGYAYADTGRPVSLDLFNALRGLVPDPLRAGPGGDSRRFAHAQPQRLRAGARDG